jgi:hypothetical protein
MELIIPLYATNWKNGFQSRCRPPPRLFDDSLPNHLLGDAAMRWHSTCNGFIQAFNQKRAF